MVCKDTEKRKAYYKQWAQANPEKVRKYQQKYRETHKAHIQAYEHKKNQEDKRQVLIYYGNGKRVCSRCGCTDVRCLSIDHINGGGTAHRKCVNQRFYQWLLKHNLPVGYQVLCMNCQFIKRVEEKELLNGGN